MTQTTSRTVTTRTLLFALLACISLLATGQTPSTPLADARGVIRLRVRVRIGDATKGLQRKRFFLIKGSLEDNKALINRINQQPFASRDCYYRGIHASEAFIAWLKPSGWETCESVYCREVEEKYIEGADAVPEFQQAVTAGEQEFANRNLARKWLAVNLSEELRNGFYKRQQQDVQLFIKQAEEISKSKVMSVMTDRFGTAYFTDIEAGPYVISNLIATEVGNTTDLWNCEITVKPGDLATEKPFLIANPANKERNVRCVSVEKPLPVCPASGK